MSSDTDMDSNKGSISLRVRCGNSSNSRFIAPPFVEDKDQENHLFYL